MVFVEEGKKAFADDGEESRPADREGKSQDSGLVLAD